MRILSLLSIGIVSLAITSCESEAAWKYTNISHESAARIIKLDVDKSFNSISNYFNTLWTSASNAYPVIQIDTNTTTTTTLFTPGKKGDILVGSAGSGTGRIWQAVGTTTNDWVQTGTQ